MDDVRNMDKTELIDLFSSYMQRYTQLKKELGSELELMRCRLMIDTLMNEIEKRNSTQSFGRNSSIDPSSDESRVA